MILQTLPHSRISRNARNAQENRCLDVRPGPSSGLTTLWPHAAALATGVAEVHPADLCAVGTMRAEATRPRPDAAEYVRTYGRRRDGVPLAA
jgi:hypothetical protein